MLLRIDYHFHPNLPKNNIKAIAKAKKIWNKFQEEKINCVFITEHSYKNPKRAYEIMQKTKPKNISCFPGIEYLTKSGSELILFSNSKKIYEIKELNNSVLPLDDLLKLIKKNKICSFIPHPYHPGTCSIIENDGIKYYDELKEKIGSVEISNGSFDNVLNLKINFKLLKKYNYMKRSQNLPKKNFPKKIKFLAAGSDAHTIEEIGNCYEIKKTKNLFFSITNNLGKGKIIRKRRKFNLKLLIKTILISFDEFRIKKKFIKAYKDKRNFK